MPYIRWPYLIGSYGLAAALTLGSAFAIKSCGKDDMSDILAKQGTELKGITIQDGDKDPLAIPYVKFNNNRYFLVQGQNGPELVNEKTYTFKTGTPSNPASNEIYVGKE